MTPNKQFQIAHLLNMVDLVVFAFLIARYFSIAAVRQVGHHRRGRNLLAQVLFLNLVGQIKPADVCPFIKSSIVWQ